MDKETEERVNKPIPFAEFPKMLFHADGSTCIVEDDKAASARGDEWHPNPQAALDAREARDKADAERAARAIGREAVAAGKAPKN